MRALKPYLSIMRMQLKNGMQYRLSMCSKLMTNIFWGYVRAVIFSVYYIYGDTAASPLTRAQTVSMIWLAQITLNLLPGYGMDLTVWNQISRGDVGVELLRPMSLYGHWYARAFATKLAPFLLAVIPVSAVALLSPGGLGLGAPESIWHLLACVLTLATGVFLSCASLNLIYAMCMDTNLGPAFANVSTTFMQILSGSLLPLQLWPQAWQRALYYQPFASMSDLPLRFYVGAASLAELPRVLIIQLIWGALIILGGRAWIHNNSRKLVIQGG